MIQAQGHVDSRGSRSVVESETTATGQLEEEEEEVISRFKKKKLLSCQPHRVNTGKERKKERKKEALSNLASEKGEGDKADRGRGRKTSGNGQAWSSASPREQ